MGTCCSKREESKLSSKRPSQSSQSSQPQNPETTKEEPLQGTSGLQLEESQTSVPITKKPKKQVKSKKPNPLTSLWQTMENTDDYAAFKKTFETKGLQLLQETLCCQEEDLRGQATQMLEKIFAEKPNEMVMVRNYNDSEIINLLVSNTTSYSKTHNLVTQLKAIERFMYDTREELILENYFILQDFDLMKQLTLLELKVNSQESKPIAHLLARLRQSMVLDLSDKRFSVGSSCSSRSSFDSEKFLANINKFTLEELIKELNSNKRIRTVLVNDTWAESPSTVGSMAAAKISELFFNDLLLVPEKRKLVHELNCVGKLKKNLKNSKLDVRESSIICLSHLIQPEYPEFCTQMFDEEGFNIAFTLMHEPKEAMKKTVSDLLRGFTYNSPENTTKLLECNFDITKRLVENINEMHSISFLVELLMNIRDMYLDEQEQANIDVMDELFEDGLMKAITQIDTDSFQKEPNFKQEEEQLLEVVEAINQDFIQANLI